MGWEVLETDGQWGKDERWRERQTPSIDGMDCQWPAVAAVS